MASPPLSRRLVLLTAMLTSPLLTQSVPTSINTSASCATAHAWTGGISDTTPTTIPASVDVVVIGAGFSGLQTAYDLHAAGLSTLVLEAHDRIGGRSYSYPLRSLEGMVELGATWINMDTQPEVYALTREFGLDVVPQDGGGEVVWQDLRGRGWRQGKDDVVVPPGGNVNETLAAFMAVEEAQQMIDIESPGSTSAAEDMTVEDWTKRTNLSNFAQEFLNFGVGALVGREGRDVGLHYFLDYVKSGGGLQHLVGEGPTTAQALKIAQGTSAIAIGLAGALPAGSVFLNSPAQAIEQTDSGCVVTTSEGASIRARKVILAIPTNVYSKITFTPPLPSAKAAITFRTKPGIYIKALLTYAHPWWRDLNLIGQFYSLEGPVKFSWEASDAEERHYSLALFISGDAAEELQELPSAEKREEALLEHLVQFVGEEHREVVMGTLEVNVMDWTEEEWVGGAPTSALGPGDYARYSAALREVVGDMHFGGGELAFEWKGYLEGAVRSGKRVAREVVEAIEKGQGA